MGRSPNIVTLLAMARNNVSSSKLDFCKSSAREYNRASEFVRIRMIRDIVDKDGQAGWRIRLTFKPSVDEKRLAALRIPDDRLIPIQHKGVYEVTIDGSRYVYKTFERGWSGTANNELAASRVDQLFRGGLVPTVAKVKGPHGPGILMPYVDGIPGGRPTLHHRFDRQSHLAAIEDYTLGAADSGPSKTLVDRTGNLRLIDREHCLPLPTGTIQSDFVRMHFGIRLDPELIGWLRNHAHPRELEAVLESADIRPDRVAAASARFREILDTGRIIGTAHRGDINPGSGSR